MIKLVISDIDGTLVDETEQLSESAFALARLLNEKGILFSLATGRVMELSHSYAEKLSIHIPYVTANGAALVKDGVTVSRESFALRPLTAAIHRADQLGLTIIYSPDGYERIHRSTPYVFRQQAAFDRYHHIQPLTTFDLNNLFIEKICFMDDDRTGAVQELEAMLRAQTLPNRITAYGKRALEIAPAGVTKASGVGKLAALLGLGMDEVLTIGDDENDLEMLRHAAFSATVSNALPKVKAQVGYVANAACAAGVLEAVQYYLKD